MKEQYKKIIESYVARREGGRTMLSAEAVMRRARELAAAEGLKKHTSDHVMRAKDELRAVHDSKLSEDIDKSSDGAQDKEKKVMRKKNPHIIMPDDEVNEDRESEFNANMTMGSSSHPPRKFRLKHTDTKATRGIFATKELAQAALDKHPEKKKLFIESVSLLTLSDLVDDITHNNLIKEGKLSDKTPAELAKYHRTEFDRLVSVGADRTKQAYHRARARKYEKMLSSSKTKPASHPLYIPSGSLEDTDSSGHRT